MATKNIPSFVFPVGYYDLHPDVSLNFQMNRWFNWVGDEEMLDEMRAVPELQFPKQVDSA